jgi:hypothetical protein
VGGPSPTPRARAMAADAYLTSLFLLSRVLREEEKYVKV